MKQEDEPEDQMAIDCYLIASKCLVMMVVVVYFFFFLLLNLKTRHFPIFIFLNDIQHAFRAVCSLGNSTTFEE